LRQIEMTGVACEVSDNQWCEHPYYRPTEAIEQLKAKEKRWICGQGPCSPAARNAAFGLIESISQPAVEAARRASSGQRAKTTGQGSWPEAPLGLEDSRLSGRCNLINIKVETGGYVIRMMRRDVDRSQPAHEGHCG
jgi:hypothetical protein